MTSSLWKSRRRKRGSTREGRSTVWRTSATPSRTQLSYSSCAANSNVISSADATRSSPRLRDLCSVHYLQETAVKRGNVARPELPSSQTQAGPSMQSGVWSRRSTRAGAQSANFTSETPLDRTSIRARVHRRGPSQIMSSVSSTSGRTELKCWRKERPTSCFI